MVIASGYDVGILKGFTIMIKLMNWAIALSAIALNAAWCYWIA
jgi:hypothetical protein